VQHLSDQLGTFVRRIVGDNAAPPTAPAAPQQPASRPATSPELNLAMIVGAQRSGTTWLQLLCAAHPKIAAVHYPGRPSISPLPGLGEGSGVRVDLPPANTVRLTRPAFE